MKIGSKTGNEGHNHALKHGSSIKLSQAKESMISTTINEFRYFLTISYGNFFRST
jgi:hypothetical protein